MTNLNLYRIFCEVAKQKNITNPHEKEKQRERKGKDREDRDRE